MGLMPDIISKGPLLKKLEDRYKDPDKLRLGLEALRKLPVWPAGNLADLGKDRGASNQKEADHLSSDWFKDWWPNAQPVEPIVRKGLITAMEVAIRDPDDTKDRNEPLPIDVYWVCHPGHSGTSPEQSSAAPPSSPDDRVEVTVSWSDKQVTLIIHTPEPPPRPGRPVPPLNVDEPIYIVKRKKGEKVPEPERVKAADHIA